VILKLGRNRPHPARLERQPAFAKYRTSTPLIVPDGFDYSLLCADALHTMLANGPDPSVTVSASVAEQGLGDCTCAGPAHGVDIWTAGGDAPVTITADQTIKLYELSCGYVLNDESTDQGGDELTVLDYIQAHGIDGNGLHQIAGTASGDATNIQELREGTFLTGAALFCLELPNPYVNPFPAEDAVWDIAGPPNPNQGHCILGRGAFTTNCPNGKPAFGVVTWGGYVWFTTDAIAYYCATKQGGSVNYGLTKEWVAKARGTAPNALAEDVLESDFEGILGGTVTA
jgi:hypothetical protein